MIKCTHTQKSKNKIQTKRDPNAFILHSSKVHAVNCQCSQGAMIPPTVTSVVHLMPQAALQLSPIGPLFNSPNMTHFLEFSFAYISLPLPLCKLLFTILNPAQVILS